MATPWGRRARQRALIRKSRVRKAAEPFALAVEGSRAFREGLSPVECPYPYGGRKHAGWMIGWLAAYRKERERVDG